MSDIPDKGLQLRAEGNAAFELELSLVERPVRAPGPDDVVVRVEAAPIHPTDVALLLGPADVSRTRVGGTAAEGAACFVNPLTALGMVETMRLEGHTGLVHTAAASTLGQTIASLATLTASLALRPDQGYRSGLTSLADHCG